MTLCYLGGDFVLKESLGGYIGTEEEKLLR